MTQNVNQISPNPESPEMEQEQPRVTIFTPETLNALEKLRAKIQTENPENLEAYQGFVDTLCKMDPLFAQFLSVRNRLRAVTDIGFCNTVAAILTKTFRTQLPQYAERFTAKVAEPTSSADRQRFTFHVVATANFSDEVDALKATDPSKTVFIDFAPMTPGATHEVGFMSETQKYGFRPVHDMSEVLGPDPRNDYQFLLELLKTKKGNLNPYQFIELFNTFGSLNN